MKFRSAIFDLDGTLVNSLEDIADSMNGVLRSHGFPEHTVQEYRSWIGHGIRHLVLESIPEAERSEEVVSECHDSMMIDYRDNCTNKTRPYDGITDLLDELTSRGVKLAVLTNKADELAGKVVNTLLQRWDFKAIIGSAADRPRKPDPSGALVISRQLGIEPGSFVYVGDTDVDMQTANRAGMYAVGVSWGFRSREELIAGGAKQILNCPADLIGLL